MNSTIKTALQTAQNTWGDDLPDWVTSLANCCDELKSQRAAAQKISYSPGVVNQVLKNNYKGDLSGVEEKVRNSLMGVNCPISGPLSNQECLENQNLPFAATNAQRVELFRACNVTCPNGKQEKAND